MKRTDSFKTAVFLFVCSICVMLIFDVLFLALIEQRAAARIYELQAAVNGLKGLVGVK